MKTPKKIITLLFLASVTSTIAEPVSSTYRSYFKTSIGASDIQSQGSLINLFKEIAVDDLGAELDSALAFSFEGGFYTTEN